MLKAQNQINKKKLGKGITFGALLLFFLSVYKSTEYH